MLNDEDYLMIEIQSAIAGYMKKQMTKAMAAESTPPVALVMMESGKKVGETLYYSIFGVEQKQKTLQIDDAFFKKGNTLAWLEATNKLLGRT